MPINIKKKILFIHIPKCSGTYISKLLEMENNNFLYSLGNCHILGRTLQHYPLNMIINVINTYNIMNNLNINIINYYIFTIIRNPYIRFMSAYNQYPHRCNKKFSEMINNMNITEFAVYLKNKVNKEGYDFFKYGAFHQFEPMIYYIKDFEKYNIKIDFIKMEEDYNDKIENLCMIHSFNYNNNIVNNNTTNINYLDIFKNKLLIECINEIYKKDFEFFKYKKYS